MGDQLIRWLNEDIGLSKRVTNLEQDFANGKLLGEILVKHNQNVAMPKFSNKYQSI